MRGRRLLVALTALCTLVLVVPTTAGAQIPDPPTVVIQNGISQPVYSFANAIFERQIWVQTNLDTNNDGQADRVRVQVARPRETETHGMKVPVVMELSPYRGCPANDPQPGCTPGWGSVPFHPDVNPDELPQTPGGMPFVAGDEGEAGSRGPMPNLPTTLDDYYVPRGYGVVIGESVGTANSDGCGTTGDDAETQSAKAIIDWLNGRAVAYDARVGGNPVVADWATGDVGMTGASYNGTIPNQVATTGVEGLKTIVPVVAISDWYDYYRENGLVVAPGGYQGEDADVLAKYISGQARSAGECADYFAWMFEAQDRVTGDYNAFWDARNYLPKVDQIKASVFIVDGRNDWNVKPAQWGNWWDELTSHDVTRKIWLHNGGHGAPSAATSSYTLPNGQTWNYQQTVNRWFDHELYGVDNGILDEPLAIVQRENNQNQVFADWPVAGSSDASFGLSATSATEPGRLLGAWQSAPAGQVTQSFVDNGRNRRPVNALGGLPALIASPDAADANRLVYTSDVLRAPVHLSGTGSLTLRASVDNRRAANLSAYLVDYGPPGSTSATMVTRGWMDVQNRNDRAVTDHIDAGTMYDFTWKFHPDDYVFQAGRRIGLVVFSTDYDFTLRPLPGTQLTVDPAGSSVSLPLVRGDRAVGFGTLHNELDALVAAGGILPNLEDKVRHALEMAQDWIELPRKKGPALSHLDRAVRLLEWQADVVDRTGKPQGDPAGLRALAASIRSYMEWLDATV